MEKSNIEYPKLTLGGREYELKFTRGAMVFRAADAGLSFADLYGADQFKRVAAVIKALHAALKAGNQFDGDQNALADLIHEENKMGEATTAIMLALGKVFPPTQAAAAADANQPQATPPPLPN